MHAIILAGGFGTRLKSVVPDVPKPMAPISGRPFLALLIDILAGQGITAVTLCVHHQWEKIQGYFSAHPAPVPLNYAVEQAPLGTGGAMAHALKEFPSSGPVLALNGDSFVRVDYSALLAHHRATNARLTVVLREVPDTARYGRVEVKGGVITSFGGGRAGEKGLINAGAYVIGPGLFEEKGLPEAFSFERDFIPPRLTSLKPQSYRADGYFIDIGVPEDYARACKELPDMLKKP